MSSEVAASEEASAKELAINAVLKRAALAKTARLIKSRLALAAYKAQNGLQGVAFEQIEPRVDEQLRKRKLPPTSSDGQQQPPQQRRRQASLAQAALEPALGAHPPTLDAHHPYPPSMSLYDAMMTPTLNSMYGSFSPRPGDGFEHAAPHPSPPRLKTIIQTDPLTGLQHPSSPVSSARDETPFNRPDSPIGRARHNGSPAHLHRRTGSLPAAHAPPPASNAPPGLVQAANALASLTRGPSEEPVPARAFDRVTPPPSKGTTAAGSSGGAAEKKSPRSTSAPAFGGSRPRAKAGEGERETAAELMLYLASSPSPQQKKTMDALAGLDDAAEPLKGRKLFADELGPASSPAPPPFATTLQQAPPASSPWPAPAQPLQPQKMPQLAPSLPQQQQQPRAFAPPQQQQLAQSSHAPLANGLPPFSTAESYASQLQPAPLFHSHPANLQPSYSMPHYLPPGSYPMSYSMPASAPMDHKAAESFYYAQPGPPPGMGVPAVRHTPPPPFDVSLYMAGQPAPGQYGAMPQFQQSYGQPQAWH